MDVPLCQSVLRLHAQELVWSGVYCVVLITLPACHHGGIEQVCRCAASCPPVLSAWHLSDHQHACKPIQLPCSRASHHCSVPLSPVRHAGQLRVSTPAGPWLGTRCLPGGLIIVYPTNSGAVVTSCPPSPSFVSLLRLRELNQSTILPTHSRDVTCTHPKRLSSTPLHTSASPRTPHTARCSQQFLAFLALLHTQPRWLNA